MNETHGEIGYNEAVSRHTTIGLFLKELKKLVLDKLDDVEFKLLWSDAPESRLIKIVKGENRVAISFSCKGLDVCFFRKELHQERFRMFWDEINLPPFDLYAKIVEFLREDASPFEDWSFEYYLDKQKGDVSKILYFLGEVETDKGRIKDQAFELMRNGVVFKMGEGAVLRVLDAHLLLIVPSTRLLMWTVRREQVEIELHRFILNASKEIVLPDYCHNFKEAIYTKELQGKLEKLRIAMNHLETIKRLKGEHE